MLSHVLLALNANEERDFKSYRFAHPRSFVVIIATVTLLIGLVIK